MRYDIQLSILEKKGVTYYKGIANYIISKLETLPNAVSFLIDGDKELLISSIISKRFGRVHVRNFGNEEPTIPAIINVNLNSFPLAEYDTVIGLNCNFDLIKECLVSNVKFILFPSIDMKGLQIFLKQHDINFELKVVEGHYSLTNIC